MMPIARWLSLRRSYDCFTFSSLRRDLSQRGFYIRRLLSRRGCFIRLDTDIIHRILGIWWSEFVTNSSVTEKTGLPDIRAAISDRRLALFGHVRLLPEGTSVHDVLNASVELLAGTTPDPAGWKRKPERPRCSWLRDVLKATRLTARGA